MSNPHPAAVRAVDNTIYAADALANITREYTPLEVAARAVLDGYGPLNERMRALRKALKEACGE